MKYAISGIGFVGFAVVSLLHVVSGYRIAVFYAPTSHWIAAVAAGLLWLALVGLVLRGMYRNREVLGFSWTVRLLIFIKEGGLFLWPRPAPTGSAGAVRFTRRSSA